MKTNRKQNQKGFTLVELAIVLVIIGLIVGGVLGGQDLIAAARLRSAQNQVNQVNTAANTFYAKYNGLPGDLLAANAAQTGIFTPLSTLGTQGLRDGPGLIEGIGGTGAVPTIGGEVLAFWSDLAVAGYFPGAPTGYSGVAANAAIATNSPAITAATASTYFPTSKLRPSNYLVVVEMTGHNSIVMVNVTAPVGAAGASGAPTFAAAMTPAEAWEMDTKFDDSNPLLGTVTVPTAGLTGTTTVPAAAAATNCLTTTAAGAYNRVANAGGNNQNCILSIQTSF